MFVKIAEFFQPLGEWPYLQVLGLFLDIVGFGFVAAEVFKMQSLERRMSTRKLNLERLASSSTKAQIERDRRAAPIVKKMEEIGTEKARIKKIIDGLTGSINASDLSSRAGAGNEPHEMKTQMRQQFEALTAERDAIREKLRPLETEQAALQTQIEQVYHRHEQQEERSREAHKRQNSDNVPKTPQEERKFYLSRRILVSAGTFFIITGFSLQIWASWP